MCSAADRLRRHSVRDLGQQQINRHAERINLNIIFPSTSKTPDSRMECVSCSGWFIQPEHQPRNLRCGHVCCRGCLAPVVARGDIVVCSRCQYKQIVDSLDDLPVSIGLLEALEKCWEGNLRENEGEVPVVEEKRMVVSPAHSTISLQSQSMMSLVTPRVSDGICEDHGSYRMFYCHPCKVWVCRDCIVTEHSVPPCKINSARQGLENMKKATKEEIAEKVDATQEEITNLEEIMAKLDKSIVMFNDIFTKITSDLECNKVSLATFTLNKTRLEANLRQLEEAGSVQEVREVVVSLQEARQKDKENETDGEEDKDKEAEQNGLEEDSTTKTWDRCQEAATELQSLANDLKKLETGASFQNPPSSIMPLPAPPMGLPPSPLRNPAIPQQRPPFSLHPGTCTINGVSPNMIYHPY